MRHGLVDRGLGVDVEVGDDQRLARRRPQALDRARVPGRERRHPRVLAAAPRPARGPGCRSPCRARAGGSRTGPSRRSVRGGARCCARIRCPGTSSAVGSSRLSVPVPITARTASRTAATASTARGWRSRNGCSLPGRCREDPFRALPILLPTTGSLAVEANGREDLVRKTLLRAQLLGLVLVLVIAGSAVAIKLHAGNLVVTTDGGFTPTTLPKKGYAPIKLHGYGKIGNRRRLAAAGAGHADDLVRQTRRSRDRRPAEVHARETRRDDHGAGAQALSGRDHRQRVRQSRRRLPRTAADSGRLADHALQRRAQTRQPRRPRPCPPDRAGADHLRRPDRDPAGQRRGATGSKPWPRSRRSPVAPGSPSMAGSRSGANGSSRGRR